MSCPFRARLLEQRGPLSVAELSPALQDHLGQCDECRRAVQQLSDLRGALQSHDPTINSGAYGRVWEGIRAAPTGGWQRHRWWVLSGGALVALSLLCLVLLRPDTTVLPTPIGFHLSAGSAQTVGDGQSLSIGQAVPPTWVAAQPRARFHLGRAQLQTEGPCTLALKVADGNRAETTLREGSVQLSIAPGGHPKSLTLYTTQAKVVVLGAVLRVRADTETTTIMVKSGIAQLWPQDPPQQELEIQAGQTVVLPFQRTPAPIADAAPVRNAGGLTRPERRPHHPAIKPPGPLPEPALQDAQSALAQNPQRAEALAQSVLEQAPAGPIEAQALAILADAQRRQGRLRRAIDLYQKVARHSDGGALAEEALLRQAMLYSELSQPAEARSVLRKAETRFPQGPLLLERVALAAELHLEAGDPSAAATLVEKIPKPGRSMTMLSLRLRIAQAFSDTAPQRALDLLAPLLDPRVPVGLRQQARNVTHAIQSDPIGPPGETATPPSQP